MCCDTRGIVCFRTDQFHAADKSPSAAATPTLSPDSCDGGVQEGEERAISMSFSRQEGSFQNYGMRRRTECATWADKDSCLETDSSGKRNQQSLYYRVKRDLTPLPLLFSQPSDERVRPPDAHM